MLVSMSDLEFDRHPYVSDHSLLFQLCVVICSFQTDRYEKLILVDMFVQKLT